MRGGKNGGSGQESTVQHRRAEQAACQRGWGLRRGELPDGRCWQWVRGDPNTATGCVSGDPDRLGVGEAAESLDEANVSVATCASVLAWRRLQQTSWKYRVIINACLIQLFLAELGFVEVGPLEEGSPEVSPPEDGPLELVARFSSWSSRFSYRWEARPKRAT
jgi:hypothetical protein